MTDFVRAPNTNNQEIEEVLDIYTESFPLNERHSPDVIRERITRGKYSLIAGREQNQLVFFALLWALRDTQFVLLDYMATKSGYRGRGIGAVFLASLPCMAEMHGKFLMMEVESPEFGENREQRARRVEFYRRQGALQLQGVRYIMPGLSGGAPTEMTLMILPKYGEGVMEAATLRNLIVQIYEELYGRAADDALLNSFLNEIRGKIHLS